MFRDDREALRAENEALRHDVSRLIAENIMLRRSLRVLPSATRTLASLRLYRDGPDALTDGERLLASEHRLSRFPAWLVAVLHTVTFGAFSAIHFGAMHGRLPRLSRDDPGAGRGVGYLFMPYLNFYWAFFSPLRLIDRLNFQFALRNSPRRASRGLALIAASLWILGFFVPGYLFEATHSVLWVFAWLLSWLTPWGALAYHLQRRVNDLVALGPMHADAVLREPEQAFTERTALRVDPGETQQASQTVETAHLTATDVTEDRFSQEFSKRNNQNT